MLIQLTQLWLPVLIIAIPTYRSGLNQLAPQHTKLANGKHHRNQKKSNMGPSPLKASQGLPLVQSIKRPPSKCTCHTACPSWSWTAGANQKAPKLPSLPSSTNGGGFSCFSKEAWPFLSLLHLYYIIASTIIYNYMFVWAHVYDSMMKVWVNDRKSRIPNSSHQWH